LFKNDFLKELMTEKRFPYIPNLKISKSLKKNLSVTRKSYRVNTNVIAVDDDDLTR
jgi:hypothetical protein